MSRQTYFFQTEQDMKEFFSVITDLGACIARYRKDFKVINIDEFVSCLLNPTNLAIFPLNYYQLHQEECGNISDIVVPIAPDTYIEFTPCFIKSSNPYKVENGRIYIRPNENTLLFHPEITKLYNKIYRFIKKEYIYDRSYFAYMAPDFLSHYLKKEYQPW